ncbi:hypothetical protein BS50DRAFT_595018 [Corynespora cassiicola Philippines]|uniref:Uncharacterized protein n=1 Tax=Corynespora cassiicola Philippines TaxID=1448308 RepID=A0A2T2N0N5_CORCC|nr:hypothetical protein BS50DRAFT_595018 [Corynespora cassiicola Philippines]
MSYEMSPSQKRQARTPKACDGCRVKKSKVWPYPEIYFSSLTENPSVTGDNHAANVKRGIQPIKASVISSPEYGLLLDSDDFSEHSRYTLFLESQNKQLKEGLQAAYTMMEQNDSWPGGPVRLTRDGQPLVDELLRSLNIRAYPEKPDITEENEEINGPLTQMVHLEGFPDNPNGIDYTEFVNPSLDAENLNAGFDGFSSDQLTSFPSESLSLYSYEPAHQTSNLLNVDPLFNPEQLMTTFHTELDKPSYCHYSNQTYADDSFHEADMF